MNLKDEIFKIVNLQAIDIRIYDLRQEKNINKPAKLEEIKLKLEENGKRLAEFEEKFKSVQLRKKDKEVDLASKEENLKKAQAQLYQLKTNKEYQAKLNEMAFLKADISVVEEEVIGILDDVDGAKKGFEDGKRRVAEDEKILKNEESAINGQIKDIDIEIKTLEDKRNIFIKDIDKKILAKYENLLETRQGLAIVPIEGSNCGACHLMVTHQKVNEIKMYEDLALCESCVRLLYLPEDIRQ